MKKTFLLTFLCSSFLLSGCWSSREIEELGLNVGIALDKGDKVAENMGRVEETPDSSGFLFTNTYQYVNISAVPSGSKDGGSGQKQYVNISEVGGTNHQIIREVSLREENPIMFQHTKVIVVSGDLLKDTSMRKLLDLFLRDNEMRLSCIVLVTKGSAKEVLNLKDPSVIPSLRLVGIGDNVYRSTKILKPMTLTRLQGNIYSNNSYLIQNVVSKSGEVRFSGAAVFSGKTNKLIGYLKEEDLTGVTMITGEAKGGIIKVNEGKKGRQRDFEIKTIKSTITPKVLNGKISFHINIAAQGRLSENWFLSHRPINQVLTQSEKEIKKSMEQRLTQALKMTQKKYKADVIGLGERLRIKYPRTWEKVKSNWDSTFANVPVTYSVEVNITDYGYNDPKS
ncbi:Ger(x)C family spore germination protein [Bacillus massilinigeriensis]|uniref:Ger(x)C family spore germination protein n=1 Tax=Bacillus mediterraneensis TaxID=1805474 RepID=UPI0008F929AB|nr:Ger(x)C family spore germination protein [Bacillus mediterraneensis]